MSGFSVLGMTVRPAIVSLFLLAFIMGMCVPFKYGIERLRGFGRAALGKLPYKPPTEPEITVKGENDKSQGSDGRLKSK